MNALKAIATGLGILLYLVILELIGYAIAQTHPTCCARR